MHRTQVILEDWQFEHLKSLSDEKGRSISDILREMVTAYFEENGSGESLSAICGLGEDKEGSGRDHDRLLYGKIGNDNA